MTRQKFLPTFAKNSEGSIAVVFALAAMLLFSVVGGALDVVRAVNAKAKMQAAADAAALAAANDPYQWEFQARKVAKDYFEATKTEYMKEVTPSYSFDRTYSATSVDMTVKASAAVPTTLLSVIGKDFINVDVVATASRPLSGLDIYAVIDMSASMGIAADKANRDKMIALTKPLSPSGRGCAFACHTVDPWTPIWTGNTYDFAKLNNIRLREDVMKAAFAAFVDEMMNPKDDAVKWGQRRIATYGFSNGLERLSSPTSITSNVKGSLASFPDAKRMNSRFKDVLPEVVKEVGYSGNGSWGNPKKMLLLVTDGVEWLNWPDVGGGAFDANLCTDLKKNGVDIAVMEIKYQDDPNDNEFFVPLIMPFYAQITPNLRACASPGLYVKVEDSAETQIQKAFADIAKAMKPKLGLIK